MRIRERTLTPMDPAEERPSCCFDEWADANAKRARKAETVAPVTKALLAELEAAGLAGRTVLDVGCGAGDLALATLSHGAARAHGVDLGRGAIARAEELAQERGLADRASFEVGDGATAPLDPADVVVLNRVVCCYPDARGLLDHTLAVTGSVYAFTAPVDRGMAGALNHLQTAVWNRWYALRSKRYAGFRTFVHDVDAIDARVRAAGFAPRIRTRRRFVWELAVYARSSYEDAGGRAYSSTS